MFNIMKKIKNLPKETLVLFITIYQKLFSFDHSFWASPEKFRVCVHYPSCSQYAIEAIYKHGAIKGMIMAGFRVLRCTPLSKHRLDSVPERFSIWANKEEGSDKN